MYLVFDRHFSVISETQKQTEMGFGHCWGSWGCCNHWIWPHLLSGTSLFLSLWLLYLVYCELHVYLLLFGNLPVLLLVHSLLLYLLCAHTRILHPSWSHNVCICPDVFGNYLIVPVQVLILLLDSFNRTLVVVVDKLSPSQLLNVIRSEGKRWLIHSKKERASRRYAGSMASRPTLRLIKPFRNTGQT